MKSEAVRCVLLADRHHGLTEGIRGLLETSFDAVVMVADEASFLESAERLRPTIVVADLALAHGESFGWLRRLLVRCPESRVIVLSAHDELTVMRAALEAGAAGFVLKARHFVATSQCRGGGAGREKIRAARRRREGFATGRTRGCKV